MSPAPAKTSAENRGTFKNLSVGGSPCENLNVTASGGFLRLCVLISRMTTVLTSRAYQGLPDLDYPFHDKVIVVTRCGRICMGRKKINFSQVFAGQAVGIKEVHDDIWLVSFMDYDLGYFDLETCVLEPLENPFGPKVLPM